MYLAHSLHIGRHHERARWGIMIIDYAVNMVARVDSGLYAQSWLAMPPDWTHWSVSMLFNASASSSSL